MYIYGAPLTSICFGYTNLLRYGVFSSPLLFFCFVQQKFESIFFGFHCYHLPSPCIQICFQKQEKVICKEIRLIYIFSIVKLSFIIIIFLSQITCAHCVICGIHIADEINQIKLILNKGFCYFTLFSLYSTP